MSDEPAPEQKPATDVAPAESSPEAEAKQEPSEAPAPSPEASAQEESQASAPEEGAEPATAESAEAAASEPAPEEEPRPEEEAPAPAPLPNYDGLESGLAWFGAEPVRPPVPVGYAPVAEAEAAERAPAAELSEEELDLRRRRIKGRFESRRKEAEAQKPIHRRIPLGLLSMVPILVVLVVMAILYPPSWGGGGLPDGKERLDEALLTAAPLPDQPKALRDLGIVEAVPAGCWGVLPGNVLRMGAEDTAKLVCQLPADLKKFEIACDVCVVDRDPNSWGVSILVDQAAGMQVIAHPKKPGFDYVGGRRPGPDLPGREYKLKLKMWNEIKIVIDASSTHYVFNGEMLKAATGRPAMIDRVELSTYGARVLIRNWRVKPLE